MDTRTEFPAYKVKDITLAELGRKKIRMSEKEMPGLMALREQGHVWLGFEPQKLRTWLEAARLHPIVVHPFPSQPTLQLAVGRKETSHGHSH